jgi:hypothetical protein
MRLQQYINEDIDKMIEFVRKFYATGHQNPIGRGVVFGLKDKGKSAMVKVELTPKVNDVHLTEIITLEDMGKRGFGDYVMKSLTDLADKMDIPLTLFAVPLQHQGVKIPKAKLVAFYKRHGFKTKSGDFMERKPK